MRRAGSLASALRSQPVPEAVVDRPGEPSSNRPLAPRDRPGTHVSAPGRVGPSVRSEWGKCLSHAFQDKGGPQGLCDGHCVLSYFVKSPN